MIGYTQPGRLRTATKRMYQQQWDDLQNNDLILVSHRGYLIMPVSCVLMIPTPQYQAFAVLGVVNEPLEIYTTATGVEAIMDFDNTGSFMNYYNLAIGKTVNALWFSDSNYNGLIEASGLLSSYISLRQTVDIVFRYDVGFPNQFMNLTLAYYLIPNFK